MEEELLNIKLLSICPPQALRAYYQEGYQVGTFPCCNEEKRWEHDVALRLIAKYKLVKDNFWDAHFQAIPNTALNPQNDKVEEICREIQNTLGI